MKHFKLGLLGILALFLITSCEVDPVDPGPGGPGTGTDQGPTLSFADVSGSLTGDSKVAPGDIFTVTLDAAQGTSLLNSLTIEENGSRIEDFSNRVTISGTPAPAAAVLIPDDFKAAFTWDIAIKAQEDNSKSIYNFIVEDENGNTAARDIEIDTEVSGSGTVEPAMTLRGNSNIIVDSGVKTGFPLTVLAGNAALEYIAVLDENLDAIDASRCFLGGTDPVNQFTDNPMILDVADQQGFEKTVYITSHDGQSIQNYTIVVQDAAVEIASKEVTINTFPNGISGNPLTTLEGRLLNRAGPSGTGGLDLDSGAGTGSGDAAAEIKDNGIDATALETNWLQRISGANGTRIKQLVPNSNGLSEDFTFDSATTDTQLANIWPNGVDLIEQNANFEPMTGFVQKGDMFIAERDGKYYMFVITDIFIDPTGNSDYYQMDIKL